MKDKYILALDQGTTSSRAILFDEQQNIIDSVQREYTQIYRSRAGLSMIRWKSGAHRVVS